MIDDAAFKDWVARARDVDLVSEVERRGIKLGKGHERAGPCPIERQGRDRFAVNVRKKLWSCRGCGTGGDVIKLVMMASGIDFLAACELLAGPPPHGRALTPEEKAEIAEREAKRDKEAADAQAEKDRQADAYREKERKRLYEIWCAGRALAGTPAAYYLEARGIPQVPATAALRFHPQMRYYVPESNGWKMVHTGPALNAAIVGPDGRFRGLHTTYLTRENGFWRKFSPGLDPDGEPWPEKKVRGTKKGNHIVLRSVPEPRRLFVGEGIETGLSVWYAMARARRLGDGDMFLSSVDLGNLAGRATETVRHPTATTTDAKGRTRAVKVPGPVPDLNSQAFVVPAGIEELFLLGDGDSEAYMTQQALIRAGARHGQLCPSLKAIRCAMADADEDFNDMLMGPER
ncbi:hypothetical protein BA190_10085 [Labrys sp. WJW]|uniref:DUF7146 domain-containing protein n=1 Tax=Labrys sp. WJW TaxID=1737983 RepID=UPI00082DD84F|nr:CHC2 zinc finger domain-containing protein [Labrys sp. WJW]OCC05242.1 hypothetical protein BA190_10085 [Labrys sp. WJW]